MKEEDLQRAAAAPLLKQLEHKKSANGDRGRGVTGVSAVSVGGFCVPQSHENVAPSGSAFHCRN
jgi:hypothetical protein